MVGYTQTTSSASHNANGTNGLRSLDGLSFEYQRYVQLIKSPRVGSSAVESTGPNSASSIQAAPIFSWTAKEAARVLHAAHFTQYALLGHLLQGPLDNNQVPGDHATEGQEIEPVFVNTNIPFSSFICGKQGSGKSYTLSCMLEGCLLASNMLGKLPQSLAGIVFNYDSQSVNVAEAAYLCSAGIKVTIFVSPSNFKTMEAEYRKIPGGSTFGNLEVKPLYLQPGHLTTERVKRLMAFGDTTRDPPLYMQTVIKTLRQMALESNGASSFNYDEFRRRIFSDTFTGQQSRPLELRLDLLESFMEGTLVDAAQYLGISQHMFYGENHKNPRTKYIKKVKQATGPELLAGAPGRLTIIDLTDPVIDSDSACVLFDICLAIFLEKTSGGKVIALDEAHNYISKGATSDNFTNNILKAVREQRHKGARIIVATQEPTISPKFLDLCTMTIVHAFDSPDWFKALKSHLRGASTASGLSDGDLQVLFNAIGDLQVGQSLLFSSQALLDVGADGQLGRLGGWHKKLMIRPRLSKDGGTSVVANRIETAPALASRAFHGGLSKAANPDAALSWTPPMQAHNGASNGLGSSKYAQFVKSMPPTLNSTISSHTNNSISTGSLHHGPAPSIHSHITLSTGTAAAPTCQPHIEHDSSIDKSKNIYMCLAATNMFKDFSPEEMRLGDIVSGRRGKC